MPILTKIFGDSHQKYLKSLEPLVLQINSLEADLAKKSNEELKRKTQDLKEKISQGKNLDELLPESFVLVREAAKRTLDQRHFDVQITGAIVLHQGNIAEMKTGEGKTLTATLPAYLNALEGKGVHIVTVNDYLARRDTIWMGQIYYFLGLTVGCINHEQSFLYDPTYQIPNPNDQTPNKSQIPNPKSQNGEQDKKRDLLGGLKLFKVICDLVQEKKLTAQI